MPIRVPILTILAAAALAATLAFAGKRNRAPRSTGARSVAYGAVDAPDIAPDATPEELLDAAVQYTFPASDPISIESAYRTAKARRTRLPTH